MKDDTAALRQQRKRDKRKADGLVRIEIWAKPDDVKKIRAYAETLKS